MAENTFLGLQPYTEDDAYRFKGRTEESQELFRLIVRNDFTVCYAESGEGKTSLLNAGVFPLLRENMYFPIAITFTSDDYQVTPDNFSTIIDRCIKDSITEYNEKNKGINVEYRLCSTDFQGLDCQIELQQELSKYSWWKLRNYKPQAMGLTFTPVFVFDQFEEVFNMPGSIVWTKKFFDWLEDVSSDSCPDEIAKKIRAIIGNSAAFPNIKEEKDFKAVFSLRKEFIGELDYWGMQKCFIPSLKDNRYCLKALTYEGAKKVMTQQERFDESKVEQILTHFVSQYSREPEKTIKEQLPIIPALLLSVVCDSWEKDISSFAKLSTDEISQSLNKILEKFYDDTIDAVIKELTLKKATLSDSDSIRKDIDVAMFDLVDVNGKRVRVKAVTTLGTISMEADRRFSETLPIVKYKEILNRHRIVKITKIDGEDYVEIVHDSLCPIIAKRREIRLAEEAKERETILLQEQTRKMRKRLALFSLLALVVIGLMALFLWLQRENMTEREAKEEFRNQRDAVQKQKDEVVALNESLNKQMQINQIQKDSLNEQLRINSKQKGELENSLVEQRKLSLSLNEQIALSTLINDTLRNQIQINEEQQAIIDKQNKELKSQNLDLQKQLLTIKYQEAKIKIQDEVLKGYSTLVTICLSIRSALENKNMDELKLANTALKKCEAKAEFRSLRCNDNNILSLNGHFVYDEVFIDSIIEGKSLYDFADQYASERGTRGQKYTGSALMVNKAVKKSSSSKYTFLSRGHQELAVITEPGGMITLRIHVTNKDGLDARYNDTENVVKGQPYRVKSFDLPETQNNKVELEIINCGKKDISFVILSN